MRTPAETSRKMLHPLIALALSIALAACGGGGTSGGSSSGQISPGGQDPPGSVGAGEDNAMMARFDVVP